MLFNFPDFCDVWNTTSVNLDLYVKQEVKLKHGFTYFVTVTAINAAGLSSSSSSSGVTVDMTPPNIQGFSLDHVSILQGNNTNEQPSSNISDISTTAWTLSASWDTASDDESEIKRMFICAGRAENSCEFLSWTEINRRVLSFSATLENPLQSGTVYILSLKAENGAGLETTVYSRSAIVDSSPPLSGNVTVGNKKRLVFLKEGQPLVTKWQGFEDPESGIKQYEWKICFSSYPSKCVSSFVNIAKKNSLILNGVGIEQGRQYVLIVKAVNNADLEVEAMSNPFILDQTPPEAGMVFDGNHDSKDLVFQSSSSEISVNWKNFKDKESGISRYEVCVGLRPGLCDVRDYANVGLNTKTTIKNLDFTHNSTYYTSTRALNGAGQASFASSNGITIDLTSPVGGDLRDGEEIDVDVTVFHSYVSCNWEEFTDPESSIAKYVVCAGSAMGVCDILPETVVTNGLSAKYQVWPSIASGTMVYSTLRVYNEAGGVTEVHSDGVLVDTTPPDEGKVGGHSP